jgi:hypothetical protein
MKTAEAILNENIKSFKDPCFLATTYEEDYAGGSTLYVIKGIVLKAMEEYASQFKSEQHESETQFKDSNGNPVSVGDKIIITSHHIYQHFCNIEATILWDSKHGVFQFTFTHERRGKEFITTDNFYGVHKFEKVLPKPPKT